MRNLSQEEAYTFIGKIVFYGGAAGSDCSSFRNKLLGHMLLTAVMSASSGIFIQGLLVVNSG